MDWECCWNRDSIATGDCPNIREGDEDLLASQRRRILEKCCTCERFKRDLAAFTSSGHPLAPVFSIINDAYHHQKNRIESLISFLDNKTLEVRFLHELGSVLQSSVELEEVLSVALTAITAGKGFGMNRAFLLLTDRDRALLKGYLAIGPRNLEEASQTWGEIAGNDMDLQTLARHFRQNKLSSERVKFRDILELLTIPLSSTDHLLIRAMESTHPILIEDAFHNPDVTPGLAHLLGVDTFLLMPLHSRNRRIGLIIADNCITHRHISEEDIHSLETFSFPVAFAIERASLYDRIHLELDRVTEAGNKLKEQQALMVKMEKMALVGRITSSIAHSIRNPLMIIGGFARSVQKNTPANDPNRPFIESIVDEARQLEGVLEEILNYSNDLYPAQDFWDVNLLVETAMRDVNDKLTERGCEFGFSAGHDLPPVFIDYKLVSYCLRTILLSDIDRTEARGTIAVNTLVEGDAVLVRIEDRGVRMSQEEINALLVPFASTRDMGNGLEMALSKNMLERLGIIFDAMVLPEGGIAYVIKLPTGKGGPT